MSKFKFPGAAKSNLLIIFILTISCNIFSWPVKPCPLRELVFNSKFIIIGYVDDITESEIGKASDLKEGIGKEWTALSTANDCIASIRIIEVLQGKFHEETIRYKFNPNIICPKAPAFIKDSRVILFLDEDTIIHSQSFGAKTLDEQGILIYRQRILEIQTILKIKDTRIRLTETTNWLIKCIENEYTRWEACYEFSPESVSFLKMDLSLPDYEPYITKEQQLGIFNILLKIDSLKPDDIGLIDFVTGVNDAELLEFIKIQLIQYQIDLIKPMDIYFIEKIMRRIAFISNHQTLIKKYKEFEVTGDNMPDRFGKQKLKIKEFIDIMVNER